MTPVSATPAMRAPTATPTPSTARPSAPAPRATRGRPAARMWTSARWVRAAEGAPGRWEPGGNSLVGEAGTPQRVLEARVPGAAPHRAVPAHPQAPTPVSTRASASTRWAPSSAGVCRATPARAARSTSTSVCRTRVRTTPPAWTRLGSSSVSACPVRGQPPARPSGAPPGKQG